MTATVTEPATEVANDTRLYWKTVVLDAHRDVMVQRLVDAHRIEPLRAAAMIDQWWDRLVNRLVEDCAHKDVDRPFAERIQNEAFGFLYLCAFSGGYGPSPTVDLGWHNAILYTAEYDALCFALAGRFLHHFPTDVAGFNAETSKKCKPCNCDSRCETATLFAEPGPDQVSHPDGLCTGDVVTPTRSRTIADTMAALQVLGPIDAGLWQVPEGNANCSTCDGPHGKCKPDCDPEADCKG